MSSNSNTHTIVTSGPRNVSDAYLQFGTMPDTFVVYETASFMTQVGMGKPSGEYTLDVSGSVQADYFRGDGRYITDINASNITSGRFNLALFGDDLRVVVEDVWARNGDDAIYPFGKVAVAKSSAVHELDVSGVTATTKLVVRPLRDEFGDVMVYSTADICGNTRIYGNLKVDQYLDVCGNATITGNVTANQFIGDGSGLRNIGITNLLDTIDVGHGGTGVNYLPGNKLLVGNGVGPVEASGLHWDKYNKRLGVNKIPSAEIDVSGDVVARSFQGDGALITNLTSSNITGIVSLQNGGTGAANFPINKLLVGNGNAPIGSTSLHWDPTKSCLGVNKTVPMVEVDVSGTVKANQFIGDGSQLTNLTLNNLGGITTVVRGGTGASNFGVHKLVVGNGQNGMYSSNCSWDGVNSRLGINRTNPFVELDVSGSGMFNGNFTVNNGITTLNGLTEVHGIAKVYDVLLAKGSATYEDNNNNSVNYSIRADNAVVAGGSFLTVSDSRVKTNVKSLDEDECIEIISKLQPVEYSMIDVKSHGMSPHYGFIAQEVAQVCPQAVQTMSEFVPNIYSVCDVTYSKVGFVYNILLSKDVMSPKHVSIGSQLKILLPDNSECIVNVLECKGSIATVKSEVSLPEKVFVFGSKVNDFHTINSNTLLTVSVKAVQGLLKRLNALEQIVQKCVVDDCNP